jgi:hypothetical protein
LKKYSNLLSSLDQKLTNNSHTSFSTTYLLTTKKSLPARRLRHKKPLISLRTRSKQSFILKSPIMFFKQFFLKNSLKKSIPKFMFKKTIFSFFKPNEVRRNLMNLKKKNSSYTT